MKKTVVLLLLFFLPAALFAAEAVEYEPYICAGGYFKAAVPKQWSKKEKNLPYDYVTKVYGVKLVGPKNKDGAAVSISVLYYSGEEAYRTADEFINAEKNSIGRIQREKEQPPADIQIAGRPAKRLQLKTFELVYQLGRIDGFKIPPDDGKIYEIVPPSVRVQMLEEYIVMPAAKGYYVLSYAVPEDAEAEYRTIFQRVVDSFEPQRM